jgi:hypothetical protein
MDCRGETVHVTRCEFYNVMACVCFFVFCTALQLPDSLTIYGLRIGTFLIFIGCLVNLYRAQRTSAKSEGEVR